MAQLTHQELARRMDSFDEKLTRVLDELTEMRNSLTQVEHDVSKTKDDVAKTKDIVEAWSAVKTVGKFVKWVASLGTGLVAVYMLMKTGVFHMMGK